MLAARLHSGGSDSRPTALSMWPVMRPIVLVLPVLLMLLVIRGTWDEQALLLLLLLLMKIVMRLAARCSNVVVVVCVCGCRRTGPIRAGAEMHERHSVFAVRWPGCWVWKVVVGRCTWFRCLLDVSQTPLNPAAPERLRRWSSLASATGRTIDLPVGHARTLSVLVAHAYTYAEHISNTAKSGE